MSHRKRKLADHQVISPSHRIRKNIAFYKFSLKPCPSKELLPDFQKLFRKINAGIGASFWKKRERGQAERPASAPAVQDADRLRKLPHLFDQKFKIIFIPEVFPRPKKPVRPFFPIVRLRRPSGQISFLRQRLQPKELVSLLLYE